MFRLSPSEITEQIPQNTRLITKNCLPLAQHIIERVLCSMFALLALNTKRYVAIRHDYEPKDVANATFKVGVMFSVLDVSLLRLPGIVTLSIYGREALSIDLLLTSLAIYWVLQAGAVRAPHSYSHETNAHLFLLSQSAREAVWFSRRGQTLKDELFRLKNKSHFLNVRTQRGELSTFEFVEQLAIQARDDELIEGILHRSSLFESLYHGRFPERRGSLHADLASNISRHEHALDKKYGIGNMLTGSIHTFSLGVVLVAAMVKGFIEAGGTGMDADIQFAVTTQLVCACITVFLFAALYAAAFIGEAVKDFRRHERVLIQFMRAVVSAFHRTPDSA